MKSANFLSYFKTLTYKTKYRTHFINITEDINNLIKESGIKDGSIVIQTHHTTCGLWINEDEKNLIGPSEELGYTADLRKVLDNFASPMHDYNHNDVRDSKNKNGKRNTHLCEPDENGVINECINGHAHAQALLIQPSVSCIVKNEELLLGRWQQIMLVELDHNRERQVSVMIQGIK